MLNFDVLLDAVLIIFGLVWCKHIFARFASDLEEVREGPGVDRNVIIFYWVITLLIVVWIVRFVMRFF